MTSNENPILCGGVYLYCLHLCCVLLCVGLLTAAFQLNAQVKPEDGDWENLRQGKWEELPEVNPENLLKGEILVEKIKDSTGMPGIRGIFTISASREEIWGMLTDYENFSNIYGGIDSLIVQDEDENGARVKIFQDIRIKKIQFVLERQYQNPGHRLTWDRVSGDLKVVKGSWDIVDFQVEDDDVEDLEDGEDEKVVVYTSYFKYGGIIPTRLSRNWAMDEVRLMAGNARKWITENRHLYSK